MLPIIEEVKSPLQLAAWEKLWVIGMSIEDTIWIIGFIPELADLTWTKLRQEGRLKELSLEDFQEITNYTNSSKIKKEAAKKGIEKAKKELRRIKKILKANPESEDARRQRWKLDDLIDEFKEAVKQKSKDREFTRLFFR